MQGNPSAKSSVIHGVLLAYALITLASLLIPSAVSAQEFEGLACAPPPGEVDAAVEAHLAFRRGLLLEIDAARHAYRQLRTTLREVQRGEHTLSPQEHAALTDAHDRAREETLRLENVHAAWGACHDELIHLRRFYPRAAHPLRLSLGSDGALWNMRNQDDDFAEEGFEYVMYRAPSAALQVGWERYVTRRVGLRVTGTLAVGQGRLRACSFEDIIRCYGNPRAGSAFTAAADVGLRVWAAPIFTIGLSLELRVTRLPITERIQNGNRYSVSDRVVPAALLRLAPEFLSSRDGRWSVSPTVGYGRMLTQRGGVSVASVQLGYSL